MGIWPRAPQNMTVFGGRASDVINVKRDPWGGPRATWLGSSQEEEVRGQTHSEKTREEGGRLKSGREASEETGSEGALTPVGLLAPWSTRARILLFKPLVCGPCYGSWADQHLESGHSGTGWDEGARTHDLTTLSSKHRRNRSWLLLLKKKMG